MSASLPDALRQFRVTACTGNAAHPRLSIVHAADSFDEVRRLEIRAAEPEHDPLWIQTGHLSVPERVAVHSITAALSRAAFPDVLILTPMHLQVMRDMSADHLRDILGLPPTASVTPAVYERARSDVDYNGASPVTLTRLIREAAVTPKLTPALAEQITHPRLRRIARAVLAFQSRVPDLPDHDHHREDAQVGQGEWHGALAVLNPARTDDEHDQLATIISEAMENNYNWNDDISPALRLTGHRHGRLLSAWRKGRTKRETHAPRLAAALANFTQGRPC